MNCDEVRDLIAAYTLGTATPEERKAVEDHLESCDQHDELAGIQATALGLGLAAPELEPPPALRSRIMQAAGIEDPEAEATTGRRGLWALRGGYSIAAVLAIAVMGLVAWNIVLQIDDVSTMATAVRNGLGIARMPCLIGDSNTDLRRIDLPLTPSDWGIWVLSHVDLRSTARVRVCREFLSDIIQQQRALVLGERSHYFG